MQHNDFKTLATIAKNKDAFRHCEVPVEPNNRTNMIKRWVRAGMIERTEKVGHYNITQSFYDEAIKIEQLLGEIA